MIVLMDIIRHAKEQQQKTLVFSQYVQTLDVIQVCVYLHTVNKRFFLDFLRFGGGGGFCARGLYLHTHTCICIHICIYTYVRRPKKCRL
jgi:hypothetical protein